MNLGVRGDRRDLKSFGRVDCSRDVLYERGINKTKRGEEKEKK